MLKKFFLLSIIFLISGLYWGCENAVNPIDASAPTQEIKLNYMPESLELPSGAILQKATFYIYSNIPSGQPVYVHRITTEWEELVVTWNSFGGNFDPLIIGSFTPTTTGWYTIDLTFLVQSWLNGTYPNYGILLRQDHSVITGYHSSEYLGNLSQRPKLVITYLLNGVIEEITIQRGLNGEVYDTHINETSPDINYGLDALITMKFTNGMEKQSLIKFHQTFIPTNPGTGTPGYWMNHPEAWPVEQITIGGINYAKGTAIGFMKAPVKKDKIYTIFPALVAAKLNIMIGNDASCIADIISQADTWMANYGPIGINSVAASSAAWNEGEPLYFMLDDYNNGLLCAPYRD